MTWMTQPSFSPGVHVCVYVAMGDNLTCGVASVAKLNIHQMCHVAKHTPLSKL